MFNQKIFKLNRIKYEELMQDAIDYVKKTYQASTQNFTLASPFAQLLSVILHLGRMILYYIEDSITSMNIMTATRPDNIRGLAGVVRDRVDKWEFCSFNNLCRDKYERLGRTWDFRDAELMSRTRMEELTALAIACGAPETMWSGMTALEQPEN